MSRRAYASLGAVLCALGVVVVASSSAHREPPSPLGLPEPPPPAFRIPVPRPLAPDRDLARWAPVRRATTARRAPGADQAAVARVDARTPEGTTNIVQVAGRARRAGGRLWVRARLAVLPNGTSGWVPRRSLGGYTQVRTRLLVERRALRARLFRGGHVVLTAPIGIGTDEHPTPVGRFYVRNRLTSYRSPAYGPLAFGTSARSPVLTDWPAGGYVGIHGTDRPERLPGRVSHGCVRMRNADIRRLGRLMPVGTPVIVR
ncbi:MAG: L,D-transpeptidase [Thermoleophilaceae bacterium]|nr:L,D-transpeptidase [Thermoleophilaceae bacterium]